MGLERNAANVILKLPLEAPYENGCWQKQGTEQNLRRPSSQVQNVRRFQPGIFFGSFRAWYSSVSSADVEVLTLIWSTRSEA